MQKVSGNAQGFLFFLFFFSFFFFWPKITFFGKFVPKTQSCQFKLRFGAKTNSNIQNSMVILVLFLLLTQIPFLGRFGPKIKDAILSLNVVLRLTGIGKIGDVMIMLFFLFSTQLVQKNQSFQCKLKFCVQTNSNMQNSIVMFIFSAFNPNTVCGQIWSKKWKLSV